MAIAKFFALNPNAKMNFQYIFDFQRIYLTKLKNKPSFMKVT